MASPSRELQELLFNTLKNDLAVKALVDGVYDKVPANAFGAKQAYISFGQHDVTDDGSECIESGVHTFQLDCWSRAVGRAACKDIVDVVKDALHEKALTLSANALVELRVFMRRVFGDPDGLTSHGVVMVEATIEEP